MLTRLQAQLRDYIETRTEKDGYGPSYEEMRVHLGLGSKSQVHRLVEALELRGVARRRRARGARSVEIIRPNTSVARRPVASARGMTLPELILAAEALARGEAVA